MKKTFALLILVLLTSQIWAQAVRDTIVLHYPEDRTMLIEQRHDYTKTLATKLFLAQSGRDGKFKHADNGKQQVYLNYEQGLERIKALDNLTMGMPKVVYLVGWQYNGHDSKYPAFFEGNEKLKRDCDANANESIKWMAEEAKKYNTALSFHINMFDAYEDSPWFDRYLKGDAFARLKSGHLRPSEWGYKISYYQDWNSGLARERIDEICRVFPFLQESGSIHVDAFHSLVPYPIENPDGSWSVGFDTIVSPYHGWTRDQETAAQVEIIKYWGSKGIDFTTEGLAYIANGPVNPFARYCALVWHLDDIQWLLQYPASMLTGGDTGGTILKRIFGSNDSIESTLRETPCDYAKLTYLLCTSTFIANYLNRFERKMYIKGENYGKVVFDKGLETEYDEGHFSVRENGTLLVENDDLFLPARWIEGNNIIAYSADGYKGRKWMLLPSFPSKGKVTVWRVDESGRTMIGRRNYSGGKIRLDVQKGEMLLLTFDQ